MARVSVKSTIGALRRPRGIIWILVTALIVVAVMTTALMATSTNWFCAYACHKVQDDTITAWARSPHAELQCMSCHMPPGADPVTFLMHKATALGELYQTISDTYSLPLNPHNEVALEMSEVQCTQCHSGTRNPPADGAVLVNHQVHTARGIKCTICHNRVAHVEDFELRLKSPDGKRNRKHPVWTTMEACFRCHGQGVSSESSPTAKGSERASETVAAENAGSTEGFEPQPAPGRCSLCHPPGFALQPVNHRVVGFVEKGVHARDQKAKGAAYCEQCHAKRFCTDCHGVAMPHSQVFKKKEHARYATPGQQRACFRCHVPAQCNACHHGRAIGFALDPKASWFNEHQRAADEVGAQRCYTCHEPAFCSACHKRYGQDTPTPSR